MKNILYIAECRSIIEALLIIMLVCTALISDFKYYKIPNRLNFRFLLIGLIFNIITGNAVNCVIGIIIPFVFFPLFMLRMIGAGDIKLFCAIGGIVGFPYIISIMAYSVVINGVIALIILIARKNTDGFKRLWHWFKFIILSGKITEYQKLEKGSKNVFRYGLGIALGCVYYIITDLALGGYYALL